ncbi:hypothetical protein PITC_056780 [Penicillium italicum]|uniref:Uncharacterized protein n=1 Tax=Penicillium italicum TaxID=40296 RepID=A0A0A2KXZ5_PENIT|nr:hypothetical protein PITC_056780 [Penicillium italicum]
MTLGAGEILSAELIRLRISGGSRYADEDPVTNLSTLEELIKSTLQPALHAQQTLDPIVSTHSLFDRAKELCQKHQWPMQRFNNFQRLLCGTRNFPCILLLNPKNDHLPFNDMVKGTPTLRWLEDTLEKIGLRLDDVSIMDLFPMLTDNWLDNHPAKRKEVIPEIFDLTLDFIREFKPPIFLSCQCFASFQHERWNSFDHYMIQKLSSSMSTAKSQKVRGFYFEEHFIQCVQGFHPANLYRVEYERKQTLDTILRRIFHSLFKPCAAWQKKYNVELKTKMDDKTRSIKDLIKQLQKSVAEYDEMRLRAFALGMYRDRGDSTKVMEWNTIETALDLIVKALPTDQESDLRDFREMTKQENLWLS